ncbi:MAG: HAMP domain-containing histidine kinase [Lachnospiraceae bacterium]|nr:HAMP domain-containing histidine kinase [Lachnospiraceae bacterium]
MFRRLKAKFIAITSVAILLVIMMVLGVVNIGTTLDVYNEVSGIIDIIIENDGVFPGFDQQNPVVKDNTVFSITPETEYILRYFSVLISDNNIEYINTTHVAAVSEAEAISLSRQAYHADAVNRLTIHYNGRIYMYKIAVYDDDTDILVFLDVTDRLSSVTELIKFSLIVGLLSMLLFVLIVSLFSQKAIKPMIDNMERQREFVTNAGHELKTPIAIISANTEVLEMMNGKNEWTDSIMSQVKRLSGLVNNLLRLARMEESADIVLENVDFSKEAKDVAESMRPVIENADKTLTVSIEEGVIVQAEASNLHELVNILVDNAAKYCDDHGSIHVELYKKGKNAILNVSNDYENADKTDTRRFFERFYREDESHNSGKQGYGIGLSMAEQIVKMFGGKISAATKGKEITFTVTL